MCVGACLCVSVCVSVCLRVSVWIQIVENLQIFPNPAKLVASYELCARRTDWSVTRSDVKASLARSKLRPRTVRPPPPGGSRPPLLWKKFSVCSFHFHTNCTFPPQTPANFIKIPTLLCLCQDWGHGRLLILSLKTLAAVKAKSTWFEFCPSCKNESNFPFCAPPLECGSGIGICGRRRDYLGSAVTRDTGDPWESTTATQCRGRLMLVHNSFKHHLEVETRLPVIHQTHRNHRRLFSLKKSQTPFSWRLNQINLISRWDRFFQNNFSSYLYILKNQQIFIVFIVEPGRWAAH